MTYKKLLIDGILIGVISAVLIVPEVTVSIFLEFLSYQEFAAAKILGTSLFIFYRKGIKKWYKKIITSDETIEGIPIDELLDFLFREKKFPADIIQKHFGITPRKYSAIASALAKASIIEKKPPYNAYVLNEEFTRSEVFASLTGKESFSLVMRPMRIVRG